MLRWWQQSIKPSIEASWMWTQGRLQRSQAPESSSAQKPVRKNSQWPKLEKFEQQNKYKNIGLEPKV